MSNTGAANIKSGLALNLKLFTKTVAAVIFSTGVIFNTSGKATALFTPRDSVPASLQLPNLTALAMQSDERFKAGLNMDGTLFGSVIQDGLNQPFMLMNSQNSELLDPTRQLFYDKSEK